MKTVVVTGAASGLGKALAKHYANLDWHIIVADIKDGAGQETVSEITSMGGKANYFHCDILKADDFSALAEYTEQTTGQCNVLINNAGIASSGNLMQSTEDEWQRLIELDLMSCVRGAKAFIPLLKKSASLETPSAIANVASMAGVALMPGMITYNVAKAGVIAFSESLRCELKRDNIHVAAACPSFFKTNLTSSMLSSDPATIERIEGWMDKSKLTAESVAKDIADGIDAKLNLIFSDNSMKKYFRRMSWFYYKFMSKVLR
jgi:NAD(P)-dependent dehydrogenase (short-subunit alcohol dehydrogenase family)